MPNYRRWRQEGGLVFLTVVTHERRHLFRSALARDLLHRAMDDVGGHRPWHTEAIILLPDHWHAIWRLPPGDADYATRMSLVKRLFTSYWLRSGGDEGQVSVAKRRYRRRGVWQIKFWEHIVRDAADFKKHLDYIHLNPVKHGLCRRPCDWPWSTFRQWVARGEYQNEWVGSVDLPGAVEYSWHDQV